MNLPLELAPDNKRGLALRSLIIIAGGYGVEYARLINLAAVGAVVTNTITVYSRRGAPQPRLAEIPGGFVLNTGGQNIGLTKLRQRYSAKWARLGVPVIVSIGGESADEYARLARKLERIEGVGGIEVDLPTDADEEYAFALVQATRHNTELPVLVKIPHLNAAALATSVVEAGAHALTLIAPPRGLAFDRVGRAVSGQMYGVGVKPLALRAIQDVRTVVEVPIIGAGGIHTAADIQEFLTVGANAVQIDSALFVNPRGVDEIIRLACTGALIANDLSES